MTELINELINPIFNLFWYLILFVLIIFLIYAIIFPIKRKEYIENISKKNEEEKFDFWIKTLKDLQPLAFFISISLILASFLKIDDPKSSGYALFSALIFMGAYLEFAQYKRKKDSLDFYTGVILISIAIGSLINSFGGLSAIISNIGNEEYFIRSMLLILIIGFIRINISQLAKLPRNITYDIRFYLTSIMLIVLLVSTIVRFLGYFRENELVIFIIQITVIILFFICLAYNTIYFYIRGIKELVQNIREYIKKSVQYIRDQYYRI